VLRSYHYMENGGLAVTTKCAFGVFISCLLAIGLVALSDAADDAPTDRVGRRT